MLFTACLQEVFRGLNWEQLGIRINGEYLNNLRFADDIALLSHSGGELQIMINELDRQSRSMGLKINMQKTKEVRAALSPEKFELLAAIFVRDWDVPSNLVVGRLAAIAPHLDYLVLETHYESRNSNSCRSGYSSVFYSSGLKPSPSVPISQALSWMSSLLVEHRQYVTTCFSVSMGAVVFRDAEHVLSTCSGSGTVSYMQVCKGAEWRPTPVANLDALSVVRLGRGRVETHEDDPLLSSKVSHALANYPRACVAAYDVDLDDYEGQCSAEPFARLRALRQAEENKRPLVCVLSDRIDIDRNVSKLFCTHIVLSLRRYGRPDAMQDITKAPRRDHHKRSLTHRSVSQNTAVKWLKDVTEKGLSLACLSVDLRVLRFTTYGKATPFGSCRREEALDFPNACEGGTWTQVHNTSRDSPMWQDGSVLQTYETTRTLAERVRPLLPLPNAGIAAFNLDYEDYTGVCAGGTPQARLMALRAALGNA
ncbi:hypothetical protein V5799_007282 [Amblyomma americanum]|uniref:Reverse transcriptase domain-containing protein n=1 Tax=Amblyomma americanum TaxID=6943 RepID=A0AAQ4DTZ4_AMBAM